MFFLLFFLLFFRLFCRDICRCSFRFGRNIAVGKGSGEAGTVISASPLTIACGEGAVVIEELQLEGKKRMDAKAFLIGHPLQIKEKIGE